MTQHSEHEVMREPSVFLLACGSQFGSNAGWSVTEGDCNGDPVLHIFEREREGGDPEEGDARHRRHHVDHDEVRVAADARTQVDSAEAALARRTDRRDLGRDRRGEVPHVTND